MSRVIKIKGPISIGDYSTVIETPTIPVLDQVVYIEPPDTLNLSLEHRKYYLDNHRCERENIIAFSPGDIDPEEIIDALNNATQEELESLPFYTKDLKWKHSCFRGEISTYIWFILSDYKDEIKSQKLSIKDNFTKLYYEITHQDNQVIGFVIDPLTFNLKTISLLYERKTGNAISVFFRS